jgi:hypothetical protein
MKPKKKKWSGDVTKNSNAMDLEPDVFKKTSAKGIASSLKRSAEESSRRKAPSFRSAMSMLNFYINRAGKSLKGSRKEILELAKAELRKLYHKDDPSPARKKSA